MASCLVPDSSAVVAALEHLKELDRELKEEAVPFGPETRLHLTEITAAITKLETDRRAAHEHLEVKTIENSKLRHQINHLRERMREEILADVAAARASNADEIEHLQNDLSSVSLLQGATVKEQEEFLSKNEALYPEREQVKAQHEEVISVLNDQITFKYSLQMRLDETLAQIEELKTCIAAAEQDKMTLTWKTAQAKEEFQTKKDNLTEEVRETDIKIQQQKQVMDIIRKELERVNNKKQEICDHLGKLMTDVARQESNVKRQAANRCQLEKQLKEETQKHQDLRRQSETVKKRLCEMDKAFNLAIQHLEEEIATEERKIDKARSTGVPLIEVRAKISEVFKRQQDKENRVKVKHFHISQKLLKSKQQLEDCTSSIVEHSHEVKDTDKQIRELLETGLIHRRVFDSKRVALCKDIDAEKKKASNLEEERSQLSRLLEEANKKQEERVATLTSDVSSIRRRYKELQEEEAALQQCHPESVDAELSMRHVTQSVAKYRHMESELHQEIEQCATETQVIVESNKEKQKGVEQKEEMLKEVEARMTEEQTKYHRLEALTSELSTKRSQLDLAIQGLNAETSALLQPREQMKSKLEDFRASHMDVLKEQAAELRAAEISVYDNRVKLEQVSMENSRLHLCVRWMTDDVSGARLDRDRYWQEARKCDEDRTALFESLQKAWEEDSLVTQGCQRSSGALLMSLSALLNHLKTRRQQLGNVSSLLHQQMLDFSNRLGDKTTVAPHS